MLFGIVLFLILFIITQETRVLQYLETFSQQASMLIKDPYQSLKSLPGIISVSYNNIFPALITLQNIFQFNVLPVLFGSGLGSSGVLNSHVFGEFTNPNNQIVRFIYEYGVFGFSLFIFAFLKILRRCSLNMSLNERNILIASGLIMFGGLLGHRTNVWLIWLGLLFAVTIYRSRRYYIAAPQANNAFRSLAISPYELSNDPGRNDSF